MHRVLLAVCLLMIAPALEAADLTLGEEGSALCCERINATDLRLRIRIGSLHLTDDGGIRLPGMFNKYEVAGGRFPQLKIPLVIGANGEYQYTATEHLTQTELDQTAGPEPTRPTVMVSKTYWLRDLRGLDVYVSPLLSRDGKLTVADQISIDLVCQPQSVPPPSSPSRLNPYFLDIYRQHFLNFDYRYEDIAEFGTMAVICPSADRDVQTGQFSQLIQPWVDWKNQKGVPTTVYSVNVAGDTYEEIRDFIQNLYDTDPNLTFVQLVGDYAQVPCQVTTMNGNTGGMDAFYTLTEGDDYYPDLFVGRFSAETAAELYTQIKRSLEYELGLTSGDWLSRAAGVCSNNPPLPGDDDEHNWEHLDHIRTDLLAYGYTQVDRIYANEGAGTQDLIASLNEGRSLVNYCGEGYPTHWVAPEFWITDAENLTNTGMLPFIHSVACWTGQFYDGTCLAEALLRSRDPSAEEARGAIAVYAAAPEQGISPPMEAQDHAMQLLVDGTKNTIGGLCYNGSCSMLDEYGAQGGIYNFLAWNLFGDASLALRTKPVEEIDAILPDDLAASYANLNVDAGAPDILVCLSQDDLPVVSGFSGPDGIAHLYISDYPQAGEQYLLTLSGFNRRPIQRNLTCYDYNYGDHAILDLAVEDSGQFIEPETEIVKLIKITNRGQIPANNVHVSIWDQNLYLTPVQSSQNLGQILPGESKQTTLSFIIHKGTPDLATAQYSIAVSPQGGIYHYSVVVHAPTLILETLRRSPQINWMNPGDTLSFVYTWRNEGSAVLRNLHGILGSASGWLELSPQSGSDPTINPGCADSLAFEARVLPGCPIHTILTTELALEADNALGSAWQSWLVTDPAKTVESFESRDLQVFPWVYQSGQWDFNGFACDGASSLCSRNVAADSVWLELSFSLLQAGEVGFYYNLNDYYAHNDHWQFLVNHSEQPELPDSDNAWSYRHYPLNPGPNTLRWVGKRDPTQTDFTSSFCLDAIEFPPQTVFNNIVLTADPDALQITLAPGEIRQIPLRLSSLDGKFIQYSAVVHKGNYSLPKTNAATLTCHKTTFQAGTEELFFFTLHNSDPPGSVREISLTLPTGALATGASSFSLPGQVPIPFSGSLGSLSDLRWKNATGSLADSLLSGIRLLSDANLPSLDITYEIALTDAYGASQSFPGSLCLARSDSLAGCVRVLVGEGGIHDREQGTVLLAANQNLLGTGTEDCSLEICFNGVQRLSIPIHIDYDPEPPGFYDILRLANYPNPLALSTTFAYSVPKGGQTELAIYNLRGQRVKTLVWAELSQGYYRTVWDATDDQGRTLGNGIYFCRLKTSPDKVITIRCALIK